jgi:hypothetical protein
LPSQGKSLSIRSQWKDRLRFHHTVGSGSSRKAIGTTALAAANPNAVDSDDEEALLAADVDSDTIPHPGHAMISYARRDNRPFKRPNWFIDSGGYSVQKKFHHYLTSIDDLSEHDDQIDKHTLRDWACVPILPHDANRDDLQRTRLASVCIQLVFRDECPSKTHRNICRTDRVVLIEARCRARQLAASRVGQAVVTHADALPTCENIGLRERISGSSASVHLSPPLITPRRDHRLVIIPAVDALEFTFEFRAGLVRTSTLRLTLEVDIDEDVDIGVGLGGQVLSIHGVTELTLS